MHDPLRPTFEREVPGVAPEALAATVASTLAEPERGLPHRRAGQHFMVWIPEARRRTWSPWLHLDVNDVDPVHRGGEQPRRPSSVLFGRFTPAPSLWTGVMLAYLALTVIAAGGGLFGYSQWLVDEDPWGLWLVAAALLAALLILLSSRAGQVLAREQMGELTTVIARAVEAAEGNARGPST